MRTMTGYINYRTPLRLGPEILIAGGFLSWSAVGRCCFVASGAGRDGVTSILLSEYWGSDEIESFRPPPRKVFEVEIGIPASTECGVPDLEAVMAISSTSMATCGLVATEGGLTPMLRSHRSLLTQPLQALQVFENLLDM